MKPGLCLHPRRPRERGLVTVLVLILILLVGLYLSANNQALGILRAELELLQQRCAVSESAEPEAGP